jgi:hypothetical protein
MLKKLVRPYVPPSVLHAWRRYAAARIDRRFSRSTPAEVFSAVYREKLWGSTTDSEYCSGDGSHQDTLVRPYVESVRSFLAGFPELSVAVDLGCGDFNVGSQLVTEFSQYIAVDVVPELVGRTGRNFGHLGASFRCVDIVNDDLPQGEVAFLRQVLQHLSNAQIAAVVAKLYQYRWLVVTEHVPSTVGFRANRDKPIGPGVRERFGSGIVLTAPPFNLRALEQRELCAMPCGAGIIQTIAYRMLDQRAPGRADAEKFRLR